MSSVTQAVMLFPSYVNGKVLSENGEDFSPDWNIYFSQLSQQLQANFSTQGISIPSMTSAEIVDLVDFNIGPYGNHKFDNKMFVNSDTEAVQMIINGNLMTFTLT